MSQCCKAVSLPRHIKHFFIFIHLVFLTSFSLDVNADHSLTTQSLDFGGIGVNQTTSQSLALTLTTETFDSLIQSIDTTGDFFISSHDCPFNDPTPTTCSIVVLFNPQSIGTIEGSLTIAGLDRPMDGTEIPFAETVQLTGVGLFSELRFSPNNELNFGSIEVNTVSAPMSLVLSNTGNGPIDLTHIAISAGFTQTNDCPASLPADSSCSFSVRGAPSNEITYSGSLQVDGAAPQGDVVTGINLLVEGVGSELTVSPTSLRLADTPVGGISDTRQITISNRGSEPLNNLSMSLVAPFNFTHDCPATLYPTDACSVSVNASPATAGDISASLVIQGNTTTGSKTQTVVLGIHATQGALSVSQNGLIFSDTPVGSDSQPQALTLTNDGDAALSLNDFVIDAPFTQENDCGTQLPVGESCDLTILFAPQVAGTIQGTLTIDTDAGSSSVTLAGVASDANAVDDPVVPPPAGITLTPSTTSLLFPDTPVNRTSSPQTFSVTNQGDTSATLSSISLDPDFTQSSNCIGSLAAGAACEVSVVFNPAAPGTVSGALSLDTSQGTITVSLSATAIAATSTTPPVISDPDQIAELLDPYEGEDPNIAATGDAIAAGCASGRVSERMQQDCNSLIVAASDGDSGTANALMEITPEASGKANSISRLGGKAQVRNLGARISALRNGARGLSMNGLNWSIDGDSLPLATLINAYQAGLYRGGAAGDDGDLYDARLGVFVTGSIGTGSKDDTALESGLDFDTQGITLGSDYRFTDQFILGGALGYVSTRSDLTNNGGKLDTRGYSINLYGTYFSAADYFVDFAAGYGQNRFDQERRIIYLLDDSANVNQVFSADYDGDTYSLFIGSGYDLNRNAWSFGPRLDVEYIRSDIESFREQSQDREADGSGWATRVEDMQQTWLTLNLGGRVAYTHSTDWGVLIPYCRLDWLHEFKDDAQTLSAYFVDDPDAQAIEIHTDEPDRDYMRLRIGASAQMQNGLVGFIDYGRLFARDNWNSQDFSIGMRMAFY
ncbi:MAG: choice-of-anchor D domain-containing protein [Candidatus Thiodiazotropha sp.]